MRKDLADAYMAGRRIGRHMPCPGCGLHLAFRDDDEEPRVMASLMGRLMRCGGCHLAFWEVWNYRPQVLQRKWKRRVQRLVAA